MGEKREISSKEKAAREKKNLCSICLNSFGEWDVLNGHREVCKRTKSTKCNHDFCRQCLLEGFLINKQTSNNGRGLFIECPECRERCYWEDFFQEHCFTCAIRLVKQKMNANYGNRMKKKFADQNEAWALDKNSRKPISLKCECFERFACEPCVKNIFITESDDIRCTLCSATIYTWSDIFPNELSPMQRQSSFQQSFNYIQYA